LDVRKSHQTGLHHGEADLSVVKFLNWNIQNPSLLRATKQVEWMTHYGFDVVILTETKLSEGCEYIRHSLERLGYTVTFPHPNRQDYGVILAVRELFEERLNTSTKFLSHRTCSVVCNFGRNTLVTAIYAPAWMNKKKTKFQDEFEKLVFIDNLRKKAYGWLIIGDLNVLEPGHVPVCLEYKPWEYLYTDLCKHGFVDAFRHFHPRKKEYSWFGHGGNGYRIDQILVTRSLLPFLQSCSYVHAPRLRKLSDHSAMILEMGWPIS